MLNEFYDFIAKKIYTYFQTSASEGTLLNGESFCLKLDNDEMVVKVFNALEKQAEEYNAKGEYVYNVEYKTFTLKVLNDEIIVAAQTDGMTSDFLCATLRNAANEAYKPLLMISANPIDSAKSGSKDMASRGMPFYADQLMNEIQDKINESTQLTNTEKRVLQFELKRRDADVFSDKASIYEYRDLLSIMSSGQIDHKNYQGFRLLSIDGKIDYQNESNKNIDKEIKENNQLFEKIDRGLRFGNLEYEMSMILDDSIVADIQKEYKKDPENWSLSFSYARLLAAKEKKKAKIENPLKIENDDIQIYGDLPLNVLSTNENVIIRSEGSQTAKKRTKNILIFNSEKYSTIHIQLNCNTRIANTGISSDDATFVKNGNSIIFEFTRENLSFHRVQIKDEANNITYIFKVCIVDLSAEYMYSTVKHCFTIEYKANKKNCRIKLAGVGTDLIFNKSAIVCKMDKLDDNENYTCKYDERLNIYTSEDELSNYGNGLKIDIDFAGVVVPFSLYPDEIKSKEIIGRKILKEKFVQKRSFEFEADRILGESQEYFAKANLLHELKLEHIIIDKKILVGSIKRNEISEESLENVDCEIPHKLKQAYLEMLQAFKENNTVPTLAYLGTNLKKYVEKYVLEYFNCFKDLKDDEYLSVEQENTLLLGTIAVGRNIDEIEFTPFHPLNMSYQLALLEEKGLKNATDVVLERLNSVNLLPYIQRAKKIYKVSDQLYSLEWKYYAPADNKKYRGSRRYVQKLVEEKISEFMSHFRYIFEEINNRTLRINLINMGDCNEVFIGLAQFFIHAINKNADVEKLPKFELHIYTDNTFNNVFQNLKDFSKLRDYLESRKLSVERGTSMNSLEGILSKNIACYFHKDNGKNYEYSHITFYEMESETTLEQATMTHIETGISLEGILSGIPSSKYGHKYRTGFGAKYASKTKLTQLASKLNALMQVEATGNPYHEETGISTQIMETAKCKMDFIYESSNWVVFVDPKVDLDFFSENEAKSDLLIIHYSDQYTSSSGYDAITVTHKSKQYSMVIQEYLKKKGVEANLDDVHKIINLFNAINGDWLLRLVSSKKEKGNKESTFSREKISIVAAIKFMLAFLKHKDIVWVPISLEEMLRVSGGAGLSKDEGVLSAKNLGFEKGPTSDDLLFIGLNHSGDKPKIYLYPAEVKTGINDQGVIKKAFTQALATAEGLHNAFNPCDERMDTILYKVNRNFLMQMLVISCKKMQVYHVDDSQDWNLILDQFREALLNEKYIISEEIHEIIGRGAVLSFRKALIERKTSFKEGTINFIEMPEKDEFGLILKEVIEISEDIHSRKDSELLIFDESSVNGLTGDISKLQISELEESEENLEIDHDMNDEELTDSEKKDFHEVDFQKCDNEEIDEDLEEGMQVLFGMSDQNGKPVIWRPNDTMQLFHTNTGIIGTMGTGKTQFTKSLITQLYREYLKNVDGKPLGILIFDYKGDYNESKEDFLDATNAKIFKPYHLPFNPLALTKSVVFKPLLPTHTANAFKDTISKVYNLGPKQQNTLFQCIMDTYVDSGIISGKPSTWDNEAPTFSQVYQRYANDEDIKKGDTLSAALDKLNMFEIFEANPNNTKSLFEILEGVVVIDLSGYDSDIQSLIVAITLDLFYSQMQAAGSSKMKGDYRQLTKMILVDEADNFMSEGFPALKKILKEGREFGVGTILSTQFLKHFGSGEDDYSKYILTWVVHNVSDLKNTDVDFVFKTNPKSSDSQNLVKAIKNLEKHHSIVKIGNENTIYMRDKAFWELYQEIKK